MRRTVAGTLFGSLLCAFVWSCGGPQRLSVAIRPEDERAYRAATADHPASPKSAYFSWKASAEGRTLDDVASSNAQISTKQNPFIANCDPVAVSRGAVIYKAHCMRCHGEDARGGGPALLPGHPCEDFHAFGKRFAVTLHGGAPQAWFRKISEGYGPTVHYPDGPSRAMPAFANLLAREQIRLAMSYLQSLDVHAAQRQGEPR